MCTPTRFVNYKLEYYINTQLQHPDTERVLGPKTSMKMMKLTEIETKTYQEGRMSLILGRVVVEELSVFRPVLRA